MRISLRSLHDQSWLQELQKIFQPLTTEAKQLTEQVTVRVANLEEQVTQSQAGGGAESARYVQLVDGGSNLSNLSQTISEHRCACNERERGSCGLL